ncbi:peroxisomal biogenesis factor 39 [Petromyzon marinus]|uniref:peroxisomal biogenesis factor 39 n=1 Tax=Petromyzon marinus TaxID=7757 RepID=UPI003F71B527
MAASQTDPVLRGGDGDDGGGDVSPGYTAGWRSEPVESGLAPPPPVSTVTTTTRGDAANTTSNTNNNISSSSNNNISSSSSNNNISSSSSNNNISSSGPRGAEAPRPPPGAGGEDAALEASLSFAQLLLLVERGEEVPGLRSRGHVRATGREPSAATAPRQPKPWHRPAAPAGGLALGPVRASGVDRQVRQRPEGSRSGRGPVQDAGGVGGPTQSGASS